jgi:hypothetical protein
MGLAALILGIVAILTCWFVLGGLFGLLAIVLGVLGASRARRGRATNRGVAVAGIVTGAIGLVVAIVILVIGGTAFVSLGGGNLVDCVSQANGDQAKIQQCGQQFGQQVQQQDGGSGGN